MILYSSEVLPLAMRLVLFNALGMLAASNSSLVNSSLPSAVGLAIAVKSYSSGSASGTV